jgi:two-component system, NtrC family, sensor kinase
MGRGPKPAKSKEAKPSVARKSPKNEGSRVHDLEKRLAEAVEQLQTRDRELVEALEQQTATGEILRVISSSPTDEKPVFDAIARSSVRLCGAAFSVVAILDADGMLHLVASEHVGPEGRRSLAAAYPVRPNRGQLAGRAILDRAVVHVADVTLDTEYVGATLGNRATLSVPMLRTATPIGTITIGRFEPVPFTDQQIELLKTFADQAVIAIENVRLFKELQEKNQALTQAHAQVSEALERQTATSEILRVISSSPTDAQPVFEAIAPALRR